MRRCLGIVCVGGLLLAAAGCMGDTFLNRQIMVHGPSVVVPGSVSEVAAKLRDGFGEAGMMLHTKWVGSDYRIVSQWKSGTVFRLDLRQAHNKDGGKGVTTQVRMAWWDRGGNEELWQLILKILNAPTDDGADASTAK